ncbi:MAG: DUF2191 domain-containing protein [Alphaproteobacteria bacterium]|nr:MAG: DUF2191 domain-containing protein [Alphaproteobacteria bacterium]
MRTTLTLEPDVAARIEKLRETRRQPFKDLVNEALRRGLDDMTAKTAKRRPAFRTGTHKAQLLVSDAKEALALLEEDYDRKKIGA